MNEYGSWTALVFIYSKICIFFACGNFPKVLKMHNSIEVCFFFFWSLMLDRLTTRMRLCNSRPWGHKLFVSCSKPSKVWSIVLYMLGFLLMLAFCLHVLLITFNIEGWWKEKPLKGFGCYSGMWWFGHYDWREIILSV